MGSPAAAPRSLNHVGHQPVQTIRIWSVALEARSRVRVRGAAWSARRMKLQVGEKRKG